MVGDRPLPVRAKAALDGRRDIESGRRNAWYRVEAHEKAKSEQRELRSI